jgi:hypothetical protein
MVYLQCLSGNLEATLALVPERFERAGTLRSFERVRDGFDDLEMFSWTLEDA